MQTLHNAVDYKTPAYNTSIKTKHKAISIGIGMLNRAQGQAFSEVGINMQRPYHVFHMDNCILLCQGLRFADVKEIIVVEHALPM